MARYIQEYQLLEAPEKTWPTIQQHYTAQGYEYKNFENEQVFQKGQGWLVAPTFVKITYYPDRVRVETWMKAALLPGVFIGEIGITGFYGWAVKGKMKDTALMMDRLFGGPATRIGCDPWLQKHGPQLMQAYIPAGNSQQAYIPAGNPQPAYQQQNYQQPAYQQSYQQPAYQQQGFHCPRCGTALPQGSRFCHNCGQSIG